MQIIACKFNQKIAEDLDFKDWHSGQSTNV